MAPLSTESQPAILTSMQTPALTQNPKTLAPNPIGAGAAIAVAAAVGVVAFLVLRKKDEPSSDTPKTPPLNPPFAAVCQVDAARMATWGASKQMAALYLGTAVSTPPSFADLAKQFSIVTSMGESKVVIAVGPSGAFYRYSGGQPLAAPELRADYCAAQTQGQPTLPPVPVMSFRPQQSALQGALMIHSPVFL